jgi:hypothetical protein
MIFVYNKSKEKITSKHFIVTKANKSNSTVTMYMREYNHKIEEFLDSNHFTKTQHDLTNKLK